MRLCAQGNVFKFFLTVQDQLVSVLSNYESLEVIKWEAGQVSTVNDEIVVESSLALVVNDNELVQLLCTPADRKELAVGFLKSEGLIENFGQVKRIWLAGGGKRVCMDLKSSQSNLKQYMTEKRVLTSSCGRSDVLADSLSSIESVESEYDSLNGEFLLNEMREMHKKASLFNRTGGSHTAALASEGAIVFLAQDIGRHNAVDKVIGQAVIEDVCFANTVLFTSGRLSSEMVLKALKGEIPFVVSRSAPTTLAVKMARIANLTLVGFTRGTRLTVYSGRERVDLFPDSG